MQTLVLVGTHSSDKAVSIYVENKDIYSHNGNSWDLLKGYLTCAVGLESLVQAKCVFGYKSKIGTYHECIVYSESQKPIMVSTSEGRNRFQFCFDFKTKALPPSLQLDTSSAFDIKPFGVVWTLSGSVSDHDPYASSSSTNVISIVTCRLYVAYQYSSDLIAREPTLLLSRTKSRIFSPCPIKLVAKIVNPIVVQPLRQILINLQLDRILDTDIITNIKVTIRQKITLRLNHSKLYKFKRDTVRFNQKPTPSYSCNLPNSRVYDLVLDEDFGINAGTFAQARPPILSDRNSSDIELVSSTVFQGSVSGVSVVYSLEMVTTVSNALGKLQNLITILPIVLSAPDHMEIGELLSREEFALTIPSFIADIRHTIEGLENLLIEWRSYRYQSGQNERMCTSSADHADYLLDIADNFDKKLHIFKENALDHNQDEGILWKAGIPCNLLLLELELLIRAYPNSFDESTDDISISAQPIVQNLLSTTINYLNCVEKLVLAWTEEADEDKFIPAMLEKKLKDLNILLGCISNGEDQARITVKPDPDLALALRLSCYDLSTMV